MARTLNRARITNPPHSTTTATSDEYRALVCTPYEYRLFTTPDVRPVPVEEAERRSAERRAMVDNMEAYVSTIGPTLRSEDAGVRKGAPLATISLFVANHPEVEECDNTPEVTGGLSWRKAPVDIEWHELNGHHGIPVLNVPLGSPG
eukprot:jgi/Tetstr1/436833/TSEL_025611.t1